MLLSSSDSCARRGLRQLFQEYPNTRRITDKMGIFQSEGLKIHTWRNFNRFLRIFSPLAPSENAVRCWNSAQWWSGTTYAQHTRNLNFTTKRQTRNSARLTGSYSPPLSVSWLGCRRINDDQKYDRLSAAQGGVINQPNYAYRTKIAPYWTFPEDLNASKGLGCILFCPSKFGPFLLANPSRPFHAGHQSWHFLNEVKNISRNEQQKDLLQQRQRSALCWKLRTLTKHHLNKKSMARLTHTSQVTQSLWPSD